MNDQDQDEEIAKRFAQISQEYEPLQSSDIQVPPYNEDSVPHFPQSEVRNKLTKINTNRTAPPGDIPSKIKKKFC